MTTQRNLSDFILSPDSDFATYLGPSVLFIKSINLSKKKKKNDESLNIGEVLVVVVTK